MFYRKQYTRKGRRIAGKCIRTRATACGKGRIRKAYVRYTKKGHVRVPASCIPDVGAKGKGLRGRPGIGTLKKGNLIRFGYQQIAKMDTAARQQALRKAVAAYGALTVWRKLNALSIYTRRSSPATSRAAKTDMDWIRATWGLKAN
jgi:hypothetical protein